MDLPTIQLNAACTGHARTAIRRLARAIGPAWIVMLADVDAASVLTAAKAGTDFGYAILLPLVVLIPVLYFVQ